MKASILAALLLTFPLSALAELEIGLKRPVYNNSRLISTSGVEVKFGNPYYLWGSYDYDTSIQLVGQNLGSVDLLGVGIGGERFIFHDQSWKIYGEWGYFTSKESTDSHIRNEAVVTALEKDHGEIPFHPEHTTYEINNAYGGTVGISYALTDRFSVSLEYRGLKLKEGYDACTGEDASCSFPVDGSHWQNRKGITFSALTFGIHVTDPWKLF